MMKTCTLIVNVHVFVPLCRDYNDDCLPKGEGLPKGSPGSSPHSTGGAGMERSSTPLPSVALPGKFCNILAASTYAACTFLFYNCMSTFYLVHI